MPDMDPKVPLEMAAKSRAEVIRIASAALGKPTTVEVLDTDWSWSDLRMRHRLEGRVSERFSTASIVVDPTGNEAGWTVNSRKDRCAALDLDPQVAESIARTHRSITPGMKLESVKTVDLDDGKKMSVCRFSPAQDGKKRDVLVSPTMREIIGIAPVIEGATKPAPSNDCHAEHARELARQRVVIELAARMGPHAANDAGTLIHVTVDRGVVDAAGWRTYDLTLWTFFSLCSAAHDMGQDEPAGWNLEALGEEAPEQRIDAATAADAAKPHFLAKENVAGPKIEFAVSRGRHRASVLWWHVEQGMVVEGDQTMVYVNAWDAKVFSVARRWRTIDPELLAQKGITGEQALAAAKKVRADYGVDPRAEAFLIDRAIIEVSFDPSLPIPPHDVIAWRVGFRRDEHPGFVELAVDQSTGLVVRSTGW